MGRQRRLTPEELDEWISGAVFGYFSPYDRMAYTQIRELIEKYTALNEAFRDLRAIEEEYG